MNNKIKSRDIDFYGDICKKGDDEGNFFGKGIGAKKGVEKI